MNAQKWSSVARNGWIAVSDLSNETSCLNSDVQQEEGPLRTVSFVLNNERLTDVERGIRKMHLWQSTLWTFAKNREGMQISS